MRMAEDSKCGFNLHHRPVSRRQTDEIFLAFPQKTGIEISCKMSHEISKTVSREKLKKSISICRLLNILPSINLP